MHFSSGSKLFRDNLIRLLVSSFTMSLLKTILCLSNFKLLKKKKTFLSLLCLHLKGKGAFRLENFTCVCLCSAFI